MAIAIESVSTVTTLTASPMSITKPTGLAVGELLLAFIVTSDGSGESLNTPSGWTKVNDGSDSDNKSIGGIFYKVADSADVAASSFSFSVSIAANMLGILYRISDIPSMSLSQFGVTYTPPGSSSALFIFAHSGDNDGSTTSWSSYSITGGTNPTWTENIDTTSTVNRNIAVASAIYNSTTPITAFNATGGANMDGTRVVFFAIPSQEDVTPTIEHLAITPTANDLNVTQVNQGAEVEHVEFLTTLNNLESRATSPTQWSAESKPSTSWTKETI